MTAKVAAEPRAPGSLFSWPTRGFEYDADSLDNRDLELTERLIPILGRLLKRYFRASISGLEHIPPGPAVYVGNHNMIIYTLDAGVFLAAAYSAHGPDALPYFLQHDFGVRTPGLRRLAGLAGGIRADMENGRRVLDAGFKVLTYPGGELDSCRPYRNRHKIEFGGRTGYIRLALSRGVPIVPVVTAGAQSTLFIIDDMRGLARALKLPELLRTEVWPLTLSLPLGLTVGPPPVFIPFPARIKIQVMAPIRFEPVSSDLADDAGLVRRCADRVESAMQATLTRLARETA